jgi:hypothetical protein
VPFDDIGRGVAIELVTNVDETLNRSGVDIVDSGEIEDDSPEDRPAFVDKDGLATARPRIVPWAIL